jgi:hypothetical protein
LGNGDKGEIYPVFDVVGLLPTRAREIRSPAYTIGQAKEADLITTSGLVVPQKGAHARRADYSGRSWTKAETASRVCFPFWGTTNPSTNSIRRTD